MQNTEIVASLVIALVGVAVGLLFFLLRYDPWTGEAKHNKQEKKARHPVRKKIALVTTAAVLVLLVLLAVFNRGLLTEGISTLFSRLRSFLPL